MAPRSRVPLSRNGLELDGTTSTEAQKPLKEPAIRHVVGGLNIFMVVYFFILLFFIILQFKFLFGSAFSTPTAFILIVGLLQQLVVLSYYTYLFRRVLVWWFHMKITALHARACVGIHNWKSACAAFVKTPFRPTTDNVELTNFKWTCHCGRIFDETVREVVPGAVAEWIDPSSFRHGPMAQVSASTVREDSLEPLVSFGTLPEGLFLFLNLSVLLLFSLNSTPEYVGSLDNPYQIYEAVKTFFIPSMIMFGMMVMCFQSLNREANAQSHSEVDTGARDDMLNNGTSLLPQATEQIATGEPIAAPHPESIGVEQGGSPPWNRGNPQAPKTGPEEASPHFEYILLLMKQGRHRMKFFPANIQGKWTDRDTFFQIKDHYDRYKSNWWHLNTLSHVEFKKVGISKFIRMVIAQFSKFYVYHSNYADIADREKEEVPICEQKCKDGCGMGCLGYWYTPPRVKMIPPIPRKAMLHYLEDPDCLGTEKHNRAALPKRREILELGDLHLRAGWGLNFKEKVWSLPIVAVQLLSIVSAIAVTVFWAVFHEKTVGSLVPGVFILLIGQGVAAILKLWAEYNLDEEAKA